MPKTTFHYAVVSKITMEHEKGAKGSTLQSCDLRFEVSNNLDKSFYLDADDLPKKEAIKPITATLIMALASNIKYGHSMGWWNENDHVRHAIDELTRAFASVAEVQKSTMEY